VVVSGRAINGSLRSVFIGWLLYRSRALGPIRVMITILMDESK
jgi:hypothetical protein